MGEDDVRVGLLRRIELLAALKPESFRWWTWGFGFMLLWSATGFVGAIIAGNWVSVALTAAGVLISGTGFVTSLWVRHRVPETRAWMEEVEARYRERHPEES